MNRGIDDAMMESLSVEPKKVGLALHQDYLIFGRVHDRRGEARRWAEVGLVVSLGLGGLAACLLYPPADRRAAMTIAALGAMSGCFGLVCERRFLATRRKHRSPRRLLPALGLGICAVVLAAVLVPGLARRIRAVVAVPSGANQAASWGPSLGPFSHGDIHLKVVQARVESSPSPTLVVVVEVANASEVKKVEDADLASYRWRLTDEFGNDYKPTGRAVDDPRPKLRTLYPGESYTARMTFEPPVPRAERLDLQIGNSSRFPQGDRSELAHFSISAPRPAPAR